MNTWRPARTQLRRWLNTRHPTTTTTSTTTSRGGLSAISSSSSFFFFVDGKSRRRSNDVPSVSYFHSTATVLEEELTCEEEESVHPTAVEYAFTPPPELTKESHKKVNDLFDKILYLDMIEVHLLTQVVNEQLGIQWNQMDYSSGPSSAAAAGAGSASATEEAPEKLLKDIKLMGYDAKAKIKVIKEVRAIAGLGLKEAKELVESAPKIIQKDLKPEKAEELKEQLEKVGAQIEIA